MESPGAKTVRASDDLDKVADQIIDTVRYKLRTVGTEIDQFQRDTEEMIGDLKRENQHLKNELASLKEIHRTVLQDLEEAHKNLRAVESIRKMCV